MKQKAAMVIGGANGVGAAMVNVLLEKGYKKVYIVDRAEPENMFEGTEFIRLNLVNDDISVLAEYKDIDALVITAGVGRMDYFSTFSQKEIETAFKINSLSVINIIKLFYDRISGEEDFYCAVMSSICGVVSSPLYAVYAATKAAVSRFIESINAELGGMKIDNRILSVEPGSIPGTKFHGSDKNDFSLVMPLADEIAQKMFRKETEFIPNGEVYNNVIKRYRADAGKFGLESYDYKLQKNNLETKPRLKVGFLSGTFDLFHIGHLNLLKKAKQYCDYLIVGVHEDGSHKGKKPVIPFGDRKEIVANIKYVDEVIDSPDEDTQAYEKIKFDYLFVGSDYKGTERFNRYERELIPQGVKIIYFPYTKEVSSTKLRDILTNGHGGK